MTQRYMHLKVENLRDAMHSLEGGPNGLARKRLKTVKHAPSQGRGTLSEQGSYCLYSLLSSLPNGRQAHPKRQGIQQASS